MQTLENAGFVVKRIIGTNTVLADCGQGASLLHGANIGRLVAEGDRLWNMAQVEKEYPVDAEQFYGLLKKIDGDIVAVCEDAIHIACRELEEDLDPQIHISLTEHISALVGKIHRREKISNPILIQTEILYREEYQVARQVAAYLEEHLDLLIPEEEVGFIALHIHGARSEVQTPYSTRYAFLAGEVTRFLESRFEREVEKDTLDYMRLVTHLRFAIERVTTGNPVKNLLLRQIQEEYGEAYSIAVQATRILEDDLDCSFPEDEIAFFALYVERLRDP